MSDNKIDTTSKVEQDESSKDSSFDRKRRIIGAI